MLFLLVGVSPVGYPIKINIVDVNLNLIFCEIVVAVAVVVVVDTVVVICNSSCGML